jgi:hypothetical protein
MRDAKHKKSLNIPDSLSFESYLRTTIGKGWLRKQTYWLVNYRGKLDMDYVGKFESIEESFAHVVNAIGLCELKLPHETAGSSDNYQDAYNDKLRSLVADYYRDEIELFDYRFDK